MAGNKPGALSSKCLLHGKNYKTIRHKQAFCPSLMFNSEHRTLQRVRKKMMMNHFPANVINMTCQTCFKDELFQMNILGRQMQMFQTYLKSMLE